MAPESRRHFYFVRWDSSHKLHLRSSPDNLTNRLINCYLMAARVAGGRLFMSELGRRKTMNLKTISFASKVRYRGKKVVIMRTKAVRVAAFLVSAAVSAIAQLPTSTPASARAESQAPAITVTQTPALENFNGSGTFDKPVPGVLPLSLLDAL